MSTSGPESNFNILGGSDLMKFTVRKRDEKGTHVYTRLKHL